MEELNLSNFFSDWLSRSDQEHFCRMISTFSISVLTLNENMIDSKVIEMLASDQFQTLKQFVIELHCSYRNRNTAVTLYGLPHYVSPTLNWSGIDVITSCLRNKKENYTVCNIVGDTLPISRCHIDQSD